MTPTEGRGDTERDVTPMTPAEGRGNGDGDVTPMFKLVFLATLSITGLSGLAMILMSMYGREGANLTSAVATCSDIFKMGVAAVLGLVGGKTVSR